MVGRRLGKCDGAEGQTSVQMNKNVRHRWETKSIRGYWDGRAKTRSSECGVMICAIDMNEWYPMCKCGLFLAPSPGMQAAARGCDLCIKIRGVLFVGYLNWRASGENDWFIMKVGCTHFTGHRSVLYLFALRS